jgi:hypothetical protein
MRLAARKWSSELVLGKSGPGCHMSVLGATVDNHAGKIHDLESARMTATGSGAVATEQAEEVFEMGRKDTNRRPPTRPLAVRPRSISWPPSSSALQVAARGFGGDSGGESSSGGGSGGRGSGQVGDGTARAS